MRSAKNIFGKIRSTLWPIERSELKKVLSMLLLLFLLCSCYSILRNLKDAVILSAKGSGAEVLPFIKVWGVLPGAVVGTWIFTLIRSRFSRLNTGRIMIGGFIAYFLVFSFILFPMRDACRLDALETWLTAHMPMGANGLIVMVCNWLISSFYVISELWSVLILAIVYWGFVNEVTEVSEAKRYYGIFNVGSNIAPILAGTLAIFLTSHMPLPIYKGDPMGQTLCKISTLIALFGIGAIFLFSWIHKHALAQETANEEAAKCIKRRKKLSLKDSVKAISQSRYLMCVAVMVLSFSLAINLTDVLWKHELKRFFSNPNDLLNHMNRITVGIGILGSFGGITFATLINRRGWTFVSLITPIMMSVLGLCFFCFFFAGESLISMIGPISHMTPLMLTVYLGSLQNCMSKAGKYSLFDSTKEMAFLPLDPEERTRGKSAIDGLGSGMGKSGASLLYQFFILTFGSIALSTPYVATLLAIVFILWISAVVYVGRRFKALSGIEREVLPTA